MTSIAEQARETTGEILSAARNRRKAVARLRGEAREFVDAAMTGRQVEGVRARSRLHGRVRQLRANTQSFLKTCNRQHGELSDALSRMAAELHDALADQDARRLEAFQQMHDHFAGRVRELADETRQFLGASEAQRTEACGELHSRIRGRLRALTHDVHDLQYGTRSTLQRFHRELEDLRQDVRAAGEAWRELARQQAEFAFDTTIGGDFGSSAEPQLQDSIPRTDKGSGGGHIKPHRQSAKERHKAVASRRNDDRP